jgi:hypothetical protein
MSIDARTKLFEGLFESSLGVLDRVPIHPEPQLMGYISDVLEAALVREREAGVAAYEAVAGAEPGAFTTIPGGTAGPVGMNTVGLLLDRLTILAIKHWKMKHHYGKAAEAARLYDTQVREMIATLALARRGYSDITAKITNRDYVAQAERFTEALYGLLAANLLIWESQEVLYTRDVMTLPEAEIRAYIGYFSLQNLIRNAFMDMVDTLFWKRVDISSREPALHH